MEIKRIHFIREILITDYQGNPIPTMQFSDDNAAYLNPVFLTISSWDQAQLRRLYERLGGTRSDGGENGTTIIIPNRPWYSSFWDITADEVQIVPSTAARAQPGQAESRSEGATSFTHRSLDQGEE